jgi:hypothetical protein
MAPSLRDSERFVGFANPTLKRGANKHCAYGAITFARIPKSEPVAHGSFLNFIKDRL